MVDGAFGDFPSVGEFLWCHILSLKFLAFFCVFRYLEKLVGRYRFLGWNSGFFLGTLISRVPLMEVIKPSPENPLDCSATATLQKLCRIDFCDFCGFS